MPRFIDKDKPKKQTPGVKLSQRTLDRLKYIAEYTSINQSAMLTLLIDNEYKRIKQVEKQGFEIL